MEDVPQGIRVNPEDQVQLQAHHPLQTTSKDDYTALLSSSFATPWKGRKRLPQGPRVQGIRWGL